MIQRLLDEASDWRTVFGYQGLTQVRHLLLVLQNLMDLFLKNCTQTDVQACPLRPRTDYSILEQVRYLYQVA